MLFFLFILVSFFTYRMRLSNRKLDLQSIWRARVVKRNVALGELQLDKLSEASVGLRYSKEVKQDDVTKYQDLIRDLRKESREFSLDYPEDDAGFLDECRSSMEGYMHQRNKVIQVAERNVRTYFKEKGLDY